MASHARLRVRHHGKPRQRPLRLTHGTSSFTLWRYNAPISTLNLGYRNKLFLPGDS
jgi:hypothetical protein